MKTITILPDGQVQFLGDDPGVDLSLGKVRRRRVSRVVPVSLPKMVIFLLLRAVLGDRGRAAAFTRRWKGPWRVTILATGESAVFEDRQAALDWEMEKFCDPKFEL